MHADAEGWGWGFSAPDNRRWMPAQPQPPTCSQFRDFCRCISHVSHMHACNSTSREQCKTIYFGAESPIASIKLVDASYAAAVDQSLPPALCVRWWLGGRGMDRARVPACAPAGELPPQRNVRLGTIVAFNTHMAPSPRPLK